MSPLTRSPILTSLARTKIQRAGIQQMRFASMSSKVPVANGGQAAWSGHWKNTGSVAMMYVLPDPISIDFTLPLQIGLF